MAWVTKDSVEQYDHTPEPPKEYTKKEKAQNWWHYHKFIVLGVVVAILVVAWFIKDTVFQTRPDVQIGYIGQYDLPADTVTALQDALTPYCTDLNGDGKVVVQVNSYTVDFNAENDNTDAYSQMAGVTRLIAGLSDSDTLYVMLIADPAGFQKSTGALAYLDGASPEDDADDWQNMVYRWTDCPVLAGMDLGDYDGYTLLCSHNEPLRPGTLLNDVAAAFDAVAEGTIPCETDRYSLKKYQFDGFALVTK